MASFHFSSKYLAAIRKFNKNQNQIKINKNQNQSHNQIHQNNKKLNQRKKRKPNVYFKLLFLFILEKLEKLPYKKLNEICLNDELKIMSYLRVN